MKYNNTENINNDMGILNKYAQVLVDIPKLGTRTFSYLMNDEIKKNIKTGQAVLVPFGTTRKIIAFVVGFSDYLESGIKAKEIIKIIDYNPIFSLEYLKILEWIANYYCCDLNTVLQAAIPMKFLKNNKTKEKTEKIICFKTKENAEKRNLQILLALESVQEISLTEFEKKIKTTRKTILKLEKLGFVEIKEKEIYRNPLNNFNLTQTENEFILSDEQKKAYEIIELKINNKQQEPILLNGVTGSGKTEIYFKLIKKVLDEGKNILFLAPEIALASQLTMRIIKRFGTEIVALWHSSISDGEKFDVWQKLRKNEIRILIGARSAVLAPLNNIGLIIIDEEHENTYKQETPVPRYNAKKVAEKICETYSSSLVLGSATPDINSYYKAISTNNLIELKNRYNDIDLASVSIVDMREEYHQNHKSIFSRHLIREIENTLKNNKQVLLLMNRRGFSSYTKCMNCGETIKCPNCDVPMVLHKDEDVLKCHWCNYKIKTPQICPKCNSQELVHFGAGTQRIENIVAKFFPKAKIQRLDSDVMTTKTGHIDVISSFLSGEIDILVGTQMIAKGLDNENITLVGVIDADAGFNLPDFRASERGFQLLMQVAGRAGRGRYKGKVIFQTHNPDFYAIENAKCQNYNFFYQNEIVMRKSFDYPPFSQIIKIIAISANEERTKKCAEEIAVMLKEYINRNDLIKKITILGPVPCILQKINSEYRFQIIIKNLYDKKGQYIICQLFKKIIPAKDIKLIIDIEPNDII